MPLTAASAQALVGGAPQDTMATQAQQIKCRVNRPFLYEGKRREVGDELAVPAALAAELFTANKAERCDHEPSELHLRAKAEAALRTKAAKTAAVPA